MKKEIWSILLLCVTVLSFLLTVVICVNMGLSFYQMDNHEIDTSNDILPGASIIGVMFVLTAMWGAFLLLEFIVASVGWICSFINTKIASDRIIKAVSHCFVYIYSAILMLAFCIAIYFLMKILG